MAMPLSFKNPVFIRTPMQTATLSAVNRFPFCMTAASVPSASCSMWSSICPQATWTPLASRSFWARAAVSSNAAT